MFLGSGFFFLTFYLPLTLIVYFPWWYLLNCRFHQRCQIIGIENARRCIDELSRFFLHRGQLIHGWTVKEKLHLAEVRDILDVLAIIAVVSIVFVVITFESGKVSRLAVINIYTYLSLVLIVPFFKLFWSRVFHPLLFANNHWLNNGSDVSYYIMPRVFFRNTFILLIVVSLLTNALAYAYFKKKAVPQQ